MKKRVLAALTAAVFILLSVCSALPVTAKVEVWEDYNADDVMKLREFFETEDAEGVKIGDRLNPGQYDPDVISTWTRNGDFDGSTILFGVAWNTIAGEKRAVYLCVYYIGIVGPVKVPACTEMTMFTCQGNAITELDLSDCTVCTKLNTISCSDNQLSELDLPYLPWVKSLSCSDNSIAELHVTNTPGLEYLTCNGNALTELDTLCLTELKNINCHSNYLTDLDFTRSPKLIEIKCSDNLLQSLNVSGCTRLSRLTCLNNKLTELDLSSNDALRFDCVKSEGNGYIGHGYAWVDYDEAYEDYAVAEPAEDAEFIGWFSENGEFISDDPVLWESAFWYKDEDQTLKVTARFADPAAVIPGDCDGSGAVDTTDALYVLRCALGISGSAADMPNCDMDGSGGIDTTDALLILRIALGIA